MRLSHFLDAAYATIVEAYQRIGAGGMDLPSAVQQANESIGLHVETPEGARVMESQPSAAANDRALAELHQMMAGIG